MNYLNAVERLKVDKTIQVRPKGNSMHPLIKSGQLITLSSDLSRLSKGDIVFCKVRGNFYVHLIKNIVGDRYQISNRKGKINGWITKKPHLWKSINLKNRS